MLKPPPSKLKNIRRARAYSFNKKGELVLRSAPVQKKRPRTYSYRKPKQFAKVSVKRGSKELTGQDRRTRIYELLYFLPASVMKALTLKQLDVLLQAHQCAICKKVFRLSSGVKFHIKDKHENRTLLGFFKKNEDVNNNKENVKAQALGERTPKKDKNNQSVLVRKPSIKNYFNVCKPPRYIAKPLGLTPLRYRTGQERPVTNQNKKNNNPEREDFTRLSPLLDNLRKSSTSDKKQMLIGKNGGKPKLMSGKTWRMKKNLGLDSESAEVLRDSVKKAVDETGGEGVEHDTPQKDEQATPPPVSSNFTPPATNRRPKLMTPKNWRKRVEARTPQMNKVEAVIDAIPSPKISGNTNTKVSSSPVASMPARTYKPKLMTNKKWKEKKLSPTNQVNTDKPILDEFLSTTDFNVKDKFDNESAEQILLHKE